MMGLFFGVLFFFVYDFSSNKENSSDFFQTRKLLHNISNILEAIINLLSEKRVKSIAKLTIFSFLCNALQTFREGYGA